MLDAPPPIARAYACLERAEGSIARLLAAFDAAFAITKYVGLVRLAAWWRSAPCADVANAPIGASLGKAIWGGDPLVWWRLSKELRRAGAALPAMPAWDGLAEKAFEALNRARPRHRGARAPVDAATLATTVAFAEHLLETSAPIWRLPLVVVGGGLAVETHEGPLPLEPFLAASGARVLVFERLVAAGGIIYDSDGENLPPRDDPGALAQLLAWEAATKSATRVAKATRTLAALSEQEVARKLKEAAARAAGRAVIEASSPIDRPEVDRAMSLLPPQGTGVMFLVGASGLGKSHELRRVCKHTTRGTLWIRANVWAGEDLANLLGEAVCGVAGVPLSADRIAALCAGEGFLIAIDGLNEASDPLRLVQTVMAAVRSMPGSVHVVIASRPEAARAVIPKVEPSWLAGGTGILELAPLAEAAARRLAEVRDFDSLPHATRRLLRVPLLALFARGAAAEGQERDTGSIDEILERFVFVQTSELERGLLRGICARLFAARAQALTRVHYEDAGASARLLREALSGEGELARALDNLVDRGLITVTGDEASPLGLRVAVAHDRLLQWFVGRWLVAHRQSSPDRTWSDEFAAVSHLPPHALAVGYALARTHAEGDEIAALAASEHERDRAAGRTAIEAMAEVLPSHVRRVVEQAWERAEQSESARTELVAVAADLGVAPVIANALADRRVRDPAAFVLSRVARHSSEVVADALSLRWEAIRQHPWLRIGSTMRVLHALVHARFGEGASPNNPERLREVATRIARDLSGRGRGPASAVLRRAMVGALALLARGFAAVVPQGPTSNMLELLRAFHEEPEERTWWRPMVRLFAGDLEPQHAAETVRRAAGDRAVAPTILLERALIAASRRPETSAAALDLALEAGAIGRALNPPSMAAQSVLYVLSTHLERTPTDHPTWASRLADFDRAMTGWLASAPSRRWRSDSGREYKSLFVAAHSRLRHRHDGLRRTPLLDDLWTRAVQDRDVELTMDLLDDLQILAVSRRETALALDGLDPLLSQETWTLPPKIHSECLELLRAVHERAPEAAEELLGRGDELNRLRLARDLRLGRARKTGGYAIFLDFDDAIVLHDDLRPTITRVFEALLDARSASAFISFVLRLTANRVAGDLFPELDR